MRGKGVKRSHPVLGGFEESSSDVFSDYICPVCLDLITEAYMTSCGHTFCRNCLIKSIETNKRCPKCTFMIYNTSNIFPNHMVSQQILKYKGAFDLKQSLSRKNKISAISELKKYVTSDLSCLGEHDLTEMISILLETRGKLNANSDKSKLELLRSFLTELSGRKDHQLSALEREITLIRSDLKHVENSLETIENEQKSSNSSPTLTQVPNANELSLQEIDFNNEASFSLEFSSSTEEKPQVEEGFNVPYVNYLNPQSCSLESKTKKMRLHFDELSDFYFTMRVPGLSDAKEDGNLEFRRELKN